MDQGERYQVADISLHEWGRKEIQLAEKEMPGLMELRRRNAGRKIHQLERTSPAPFERFDRRAGRRYLVEKEQPRVLERRIGNGAQDRLGDEPQRTLAADHQVRQDLHGIVVIDERVQRVAHRILEPVLVTDPAHQLRIVPDARLERLDPRGDFRSVAT